MKDFEEFRQKMSAGEMKSLESKVLEALKEKDYDPVTSMKLFSVRMTMGILEQYHKWQNS